MLPLLAEACMNARMTGDANWVGVTCPERTIWNDSEHAVPRLYRRDV